MNNTVNNTLNNTTDCKVGYYRADFASYAEKKYPIATAINSANQLRTYHESNKHTYQFNQAHSAQPSMEDEVFGENSQYHREEFYKHKTLLLIALEESSGSIRHKVESVTRANGSLKISITRIMPEIGTADMAQWHIVLALNKLPQETKIDITSTDQINNPNSARTTDYQ